MGPTICIQTSASYNVMIRELEGIMKASELIFEIAGLIEKYGDLEIYCECDGLLVELRSIALLNEPYFSSSVFTIYLRSNDMDPSTSDALASPS